MILKSQKTIEQSLPEGQLVNRAWLNKQGFNRSRVDYALRAGKLESVSHGVYRLPGPPLKWEHIVYSLTEMGCPVHVGGRSALELQGFAHYLPLEGVQRIDLYGSGNIPAWTFNFSTSFRFKKHARRLFEEPLKSAISLKPFGAWDWQIPYSMPELALLELLAEVSEAADFSMADKFFEGVVNLRPQILNDLLISCKQVKTKRLFLWFSDRHNHSWREFLEIQNVNLGRGKRMLIKGGAYDATYQITIPKEMASGNKQPIY